MISVLVASGVANGLLYGLIALGVVVLSKAANAVNFAQGDVVALGGFVAFTTLKIFGFGILATIGVVLLVALLVGCLVYVALKRLLKPEHANGLLIGSIGLSFLIKGVIRLIWGGQGDYLATPPMFSGAPLILMGGKVVIPLQYLVMTAGAIVILVVFSLFFRFSRLGLFMRSVADNARAAMIVGIPTSFVLCSAVVLSIVIAAIAGFLLAPATLLYPDMGFSLFLKGFAAAIVGGISSLPGAIVGGVLLGLVESIVSGYVSSRAQDLSAFVLIFSMLLFFPRGLFGEKKRRAV